MTRTKFGIAIHGGAGTIRKSTMSASKEAKYSDALSKALDKGYQLSLIHISEPTRPY